MSSTLTTPARGLAGAAARRATPPPRPASRSWWRDLAGSFTWLSLLAVVALWVGDGGVQKLGSVAGLLKGSGQLTGLVASDLLLLQVLLMARLPWVERAYGQDELARKHRIVGFASFNLMIAHIVLITLGYSAGSNSGVLSKFVEMVLSYPGMLIAAVGTMFLVMVVVTSIRLARAKLRHESWHLLHLYAYLGVGLALPHQLWTGGDFLASPAAATFWWSMWALTALSVLVFRIALPVWRTLRHGLVVERVVTEAPGVTSVYITGRRLDRLATRAGQFFIWRFLDGPGWTRGHPYSLSAAPDGRSLRITVKALGEGSTRVGSLQPGTRVLVEGPYGRLSGDARTRRCVTLMASGIGITPMRALLEEFDYAPDELTLIYRTSGIDDIVFRQELDALARGRGAKVWYVPGPRSRTAGSWLPAGQERLDPAQALLQLVPRLPYNDVYVCGPQPWMDAVEDAALRAGVAPEQLHLERFGF
jgi:predicted ferric reductase